MKYCKCITFGDVFFLVPLADPSAKEKKTQFKSTLNSQKFQISPNIVHAKYETFTVPWYTSYAIQPSTYIHT